MPSHICQYTELLQSRMLRRQLAYIQHSTCVLLDRLVTHHHYFRVALVLDDIHGILCTVHDGTLNLWLTERLQQQQMYVVRL